MYNSLLYDRLGQCGLGANKRSTIPPYPVSKIQTPTQIPNLSGIAKVTCGDNHTLALSKNGIVYGWGHNSSLQLSHEKRIFSCYGFLC